MEKENEVVVAWRAIVGEIRKMRLGDAFLFFNAFKEESESERRNRRQ